MAEIPQGIQGQIHDFLSYFQTTWVSGSSVAGVSFRPALFPPALWNVRGRTLQRINRTNNPVESFHSKLKKTVRVHHPTIWAFLEGMRLQQADTDGQIALMLVGERPPKRKAAYIERDNRIFSAAMQFGT